MTKTKYRHGMTINGIKLKKELEPRVTFAKTKSVTRMGLFVCHCGKEFKTAISSVVRSKTTACGCVRARMRAEKNLKHGMANSRFYKTWSQMKSRCNNKNNPSYKYYGGRGIATCGTWECFMSFKEDMYKPYIDHVSAFGEKNTTIDRIDVDIGYSKENCRWATWGQQSQNTRRSVIVRYDGKDMCVAALERLLNINEGTLYYRIRVRGWDVERAVSTPIGSRS